MKTVYESFDGKRFEDKYDCLEHEKSFLEQKADVFIDTAKMIKSYCDNAEDCGGCPFYEEMMCRFREFSCSTPADW